MRDIKDLVDIQREYFYTKETLSIDFRLKQLILLKNIIKKNEDKILEALNKDLNKANFEGYATELGIVLEEINYTVKNLKKWSRPKRAKSQISHFPASCFSYPEPYGVTLVISPWNYPFQLSVAPMIGAIAGGNTVILKPSNKSVHVSKVLTKLIEDNFDEKYIAVVNGGREENTELLNQKFDYIFFTGSVPVGRVVMEAAAKHLTPTTLELGGKSPCIVDNDVDIKTTAKRIVWGKFLNAGQTCVAPDYVYVHKDVKASLIDSMIYYIKEFYGKNPKESKDYPRIIDSKQFDRLIGYLKDGSIEFGGDFDKEQLYIAPTILNNIAFNSSIMQEEIFGPIMPILEFESLDDVIDVVNSRPKPLALYFFSKSESSIKKILNYTSSGGVCINETIMHVASLYLPFGGVGESGMGKYHGRASFDTFTHYKSVVKKGFSIDVPLRYPPYNDKIKYIKKIFK
ncbi:aldehyde dehydrogenase [uncultured Clostridium sp.]|uniref:aldehyde dehydrogenase n=1 Tax=uncultured Clostridium sp. TaxID=59620 RepID=UPI00258ADC56|nr:aldehyde dehydrogenase [uncultured Clostridium sp.]MDU1350612.1 aldehyde dehydrogenase [Clostridium argentinense]